jgi:hypothetical protein
LRARRFFRLRGGGDGDEGTGDEGTGDEGEDAGLYLSNNATGYNCVYKTGSSTFFIRTESEVVRPFPSAIVAARMYKRIKDGKVTLTEARTEAKEAAVKAKLEAKEAAVKAKLEAKKAKLEAELEEIYEKLAALE